MNSLLFCAPSSQTCQPFSSSQSRFPFSGDKSCSKLRLSRFGLAESTGYYQSVSYRRCHRIVETLGPVRILSLSSVRLSIHFIRPPNIYSLAVLRVLGHRLVRPRTGPPLHPLGGGSLNSQPLISRLNLHHSSLGLGVYRYTRTCSVTAAPAGKRRTTRAIIRPKVCPVQLFVAVFSRR